jgi:hypothetical protein
MCRGNVLENEAENWRKIQKVFLSYLPYFEELKIGL